MSELRIPPGAFDRLEKRMAEERTRADREGTQSAGRFGFGEGQLPGRIGRYVVKGLLGRGGMGVVYRAFDAENKTDVAVKVVALEGAEVRKRLAREGAAIARLEHEGIVRIHEVGEELGRPFLAMELVEGASLDEAFAGTDVRGRVGILEKVARAVAYAHAQGIVHRDLKPANVRVGAGGRPRVMDFGLAQVEGEGTRLTHSGTILGTPAWMAPEQVLGETAGPEADVYAMGVILYQALTGKLPFAADNLHQLYRQILNDEPARPAGAPAALEAVCLSALEKSPRLRTPSASAFADDLAAWLAGRPVRARLPGPLARLFRRARRNPAATAAVALAACVLLIAGAVLFRQSLQHAREQRARDLFRDAQTFSSQALLAALAGDPDTGRRLMEAFEGKLAEAKASDGAFEGGWFERAEFRRVMGDEAGAWAALEEGLARDPGNAVGRLAKGILLASKYRRELRRAGAEAERKKKDASAEGLERAEPVLARLREAAEAELDAGVRGLGGQGTPSARLARAELAIVRRNFEEAARHLEGLEWPDAKLLRGTIAEGSGQAAEAEEWYTRAIATRERHWESWEARAGVRERQANQAWEPGEATAEVPLAGAIADWTRVVEAEPRRTVARLGRAAAEWRMGEMLVYRDRSPAAHARACIADAENVLASEPANFEALLWKARGWRQLGDCQVREGDPQEAYGRAIDAFAEAEKRNAGSAGVAGELAGAYRMLAYWRRTQGKGGEADYGRALAAYDRSLRIEPSQWDVHANKGHIFSELDRWPEALASFEAALGLSGSADTFRDALDEARRRAAAK